MSRLNLFKSRFDGTPASSGEQGTPSTSFLPETELYDRYMGVTIFRARAWRNMAFATLGILSVSVIGNVWQATQSDISTYIVTLDKGSGETVIVGEAREISYEVEDQVIKTFLRNTIVNLRSIPLDPVVMSQRWDEGKNFLKDVGLEKAYAWASDQNLSEKINKEIISIEVIDVNAVEAKRRYRARWKETVFDKSGKVKERQRWSAEFTIELNPPKSKEKLKSNPIGLYIVDFDWSQEV
jgi:type IV secretion system protein TrbF